MRTDQITQVDVSTGLLRAELIIYASGQGRITVAGLRRSEAEKLRHTLENVMS